MGMVSKKRILIIITIVLLIFTSCNKKSDDNAEIQLWYYEYANQIDYNKAIKMLIPEIEKYAEEQEIPLQIIKYSNKELSYEDYVLKRNISATKGNIIIIEDAKLLNDLSGQHADYTKLKNYDELLDEYKNRFCIPIGIQYIFSVVDENILDYYNIKIDNSVLMYDEYLELKQEMKSKGAKFYVNTTELVEKIYYFQNKYDLLYVNDTSEIINNPEKFKSNLKSTIINVCDDFIKYNEGKFNYDSIFAREEFGIYDDNLGLSLDDSNNGYYYNPSLSYYPSSKDDYEFFSTRITIVYLPIWTNITSPCFYMHKKITNNKIWDLADFIVSEESYKTISQIDPIYAPVFKGEITRNILELDENFKYIIPDIKIEENGEEKSKRISDQINERIEVLMINEETRNQLANYYFINKDYGEKILEFIIKIITNLSENNFDYKNEEINKTIDTEISEFVNNFIIHNK